MQRILRGCVTLLCCLGTLAHAGEDQRAGRELAKLKTLDLQTAQSIALADNPDMAAAQARIEQARARVRQATAAWLPSVDVSGAGARQRLSDATYQYNNALAKALGSSADQTDTNYSANLQGTWVLFDGFYRTFKERQAVYDEKSVVAARVNSQRLLVNSVAEAFLNAQLAQTYIDIARADESFYTRQLEDAQNRYNVGAGPWGDVLNIKVQVNSAKTTLIRSQREYEAAGYGLAALMGLPEAAFPAGLRLASLDKTADVSTALKEKPETLIQEALKTRPDIQRLEMIVQQAEAAGGMAKATFYPKVQASGTLEGAKTGDMGLSGEDFGNTVGVSMRWNLYAGGADQARLIETEQAKREAVYTLANLRNSVAAEIRQDIAMLAAAEEQVRLQRDTVQLVQENRDLAKNEYEAGESSLVRLNEAQRDLTTTHGRLAQALVSSQLQRQRLLAAAGRNLASFDAPSAKP